MASDLDHIHATFLEARDATGRIVFGIDDLFEQLLIAWILKGHCLLAGPPGSGQFTLVESLARMFGLTLSRISFAPDGSADRLLDAVFAPSSKSLNGTTLARTAHNVEPGEDPTRASAAHENLRCPNIVYGEEIHRGSPFAQCVLLDSIVNGSFVHQGQRIATPNPFLFIASEGLEENESPTLTQLQTDRFMFRLAFKSPCFEHELKIAGAKTPALETDTSPSVQVFSVSTLMGWRELLEQVAAPPDVVEFAVRLVRGTRVHEGEHSDFAYEWIRHGAGPRASNVLVQAARVRALLHGRSQCGLGDVRFLTHAVLRHRIALNKNARSSGIESDQVIDRLLDETPQ